MTTTLNISTLSLEKLINLEVDLTKNARSNEEVKQLIEIRTEISLKENFKF